MENLTAYSMQVYTNDGVKHRFIVFARNKYDALAVSVREMRNIKNVDLETLRVVRRISSGADEPVMVYLSGQLFPQKEQAQKNKKKRKIEIAQKLNRRRNEKQNGK